MKKEIFVAETQEEAVQLLEKELEIAPIELVEEAVTEAEAEEAGEKELDEVLGAGEPLVYQFENFEFVVDSINEDGQYLAHRKDSANKCLLTLENDKIVKISYLSV